MKKILTILLCTLLCAITLDAVPCPPTARCGACGGKKTTNKNADNNKVRKARFHKRHCKKGHHHKHKHHHGRPNFNFGPG